MLSLCAILLVGAVAALTDGAVAERHTAIWFAYFAGFTLTLGFKFAKALYMGKTKDGKSYRKTAGEWFFEPSIPNLSSWTATFGGVWVLGSIYINRIVAITGLTDLPLDAGVAFFLGSIFEFTVPAITKKFVSLIPGAS